MENDKITGSIFHQGMSKGRHLGYLEALQDILKKEQRVILMTDDIDSRFETEAFIVESKHIRSLLKDMTRDRNTDN